MTKNHLSQILISPLFNQENLIHDLDLEDVLIVDNGDQAIVLVEYNENKHQLAIAHINGDSEEDDTYHIKHSSLIDDETINENLFKVISLLPDIEVEQFLKQLDLKQYAAISADDFSQDPEKFAGQWFVVQFVSAEIDGDVNSSGKQVGWNTGEFKENLRLCLIDKFGQLTYIDSFHFGLLTWQSDEDSPIYNSNEDEMIGCLYPVQIGPQYELPILR